MTKDIKDLEEEFAVIIMRRDINEPHNPLAMFDDLMHVLKKVNEILSKNFSLICESELDDSKFDVYAVSCEQAFALREQIINSVIKHRYFLFDRRQALKLSEEQKYPKKKQKYKQFI